MASASPPAAPSLSDTSRAVVETLPADPLKEHLDTLRAQQQRVRQEKKDLSKAVKAAKKKQQRLRHRTRLMSSEDLVAALLMHKETAEKRAAREPNGHRDEMPPGSVSQSSGATCPCPNTSSVAVQETPPEGDTRDDVEMRREREASGEE